MPIRVAGAPEFEPPCQIHWPVKVPALLVLPRGSGLGGVPGIHSHTSFRRAAPPSTTPCPPNNQRLPLTGSVQVELPQRAPGNPFEKLWRVPYKPDPSTTSIGPGSTSQSPALSRKVGRLAGSQVPSKTHRSFRRP